MEFITGSKTSHSQYKLSSRKNNNTIIQSHNVNMWEKLRIFLVLVHKNLIVRVKRHYIGSIIELALPVCIIALNLAIRSLPGYANTPFPTFRTFRKNETYYPIITKDDLIDNIPRSLIHLYYKPKNNFTNRLMDDVLWCTKLPRNQVLGFDKEHDMLQHYQAQQGDDTLIRVFAIDFKHVHEASVPNKLTYMIRSRYLIPQELFESDVHGPSTKADRLITEIPLIPLQMCLDNAFIDTFARSNAEKPTVVMQMMPYPAHVVIDSLELSMQTAISVLGGVMFFATIYLIPTYVCAEKTTGVNTLLKMNGVKSYQNFLSWLVTGVLFGIINVSAVTIMVKLESFDQIPLYHKNNCVIIWLSLIFNYIHIYAFCLHVASYFSKAWVTQMIATTVPLIINIISMHLKNTNKFVLVPYFGFIFPTVATMRIFDELNRRNNELTGAHLSNLFQTANQELNITGSLGFIMFFSILGTIFHFIVALYLEAVIPSKYGVPKQPLFFLKYFKRNQISNNYGAEDVVSSDGQPKISEPVADGTLIPGIQLRNLAKTFTSGYFKARTVDAVRGITLDFYKGQITALLGHNGAGKTTTLSILTGLTAPSAGAVYINGKDITKNLDEIRSDLGVCPQANTMFPDLTVLEQLRLVGLLKQKNKTRKQVMQDVDDLLKKLDISEKQHVMPKKLSGGQKRRVCLGMALIGDATTIFLDEPTSGMDPQTSRGTWDIILRYRNQKTIIITTHSMEEADVLGDRIAIMHSGKMKCYGSSMFLKKFYGHNYHDVTLSTTPSCNVDKIREMVGSEARINVEHHGRIIINIPFTNSLPKILDNMDNRKAEIGITGLSVSMITLDQVFLKAAEEEENNGPVDDVDGTEEPAAKVYQCLTGAELTWQRINALILKKVTYLRTNKSLFETIIFMVPLAIALPAILNNIGRSSHSQNLLLHVGLYDSSEALISSKTQILGETYKNIIEEQGAKGTLMKSDDSLTSKLLSVAETDLAYYKSRIIISAEFNSSLSANGFYSGGATLSAPITLNAMSNLVLKTVAGNQYSIDASIGDLPQLSTEDFGHGAFNRFNIIAEVFILFTIFFYLAALFVKHPLLENTVRVKQLQQMAGASPLLYWATMFVVDYTVYILVTLSIIVGLFVTDLSTESSVLNAKVIGILLLLFLLFGINVLLLIYVCSFMKKPFHTVFLLLGGLPLFLVFIVVILNEVLSDLPSTKIGNLIMRRILSLEPHISFVFGYVKALEIASGNALCQGLYNNPKVSIYSRVMCCGRQGADENCTNVEPYFTGFRGEGGLEEFVTYLFLTPIILVGILSALEMQGFGKLVSKLRPNNGKSDNQDQTMDTQVEKEKSIVRQAINQRVSKPDLDDENVFLAFELSKCYGKLEAVKEVSFRVKKNECFGLLGVNGAGKSTTFRMLVGEEIPTNGVLHRGFYNMKSNRAEYLVGMGYCPQNDALIPYFNAIDHLSLFARLRGIPDSEITSEVSSWIEKLRLNKHAKNPSGSYSGGNKRRLNIAIALIGSPKMVLLDEPTTGVDPAARRLVWTVLQNCQASGQAIILTSHSMEECEALCNRLVIMVRGRLLCVGASQELKERFGAGFNIIVKLDPERSDEVFMKIKNKIQSTFTCELKDEHSGYLFYHITDSEATWVKMFETMNFLKAKYEWIEDFTVSTSTLEQLFMQFARSSTEITTKSQEPIQTAAAIIHV